MDTTAHAHPFVTKFTEFWRDPSPESLPELLHHDVVLQQPLAPRVTGIKEAQRQFGRFCSCLPGLHAEVDCWSGADDLVFIEFTLIARLGRETLAWPTVNRLILRDGKATERAAYFDPLVVLPALLRHPSVGWRWLKP
ncbi:hypothetical protein A5662_21380 [Mycobacteriaceae bacterium 1482268.1]|nr:hypothetical protein A5662_21380 [Mycobacteriaceae bacterium 1482268.1]